MGYGVYGLGFKHPIIRYLGLSNNDFSTGFG